MKKWSVPTAKAEARVLKFVSCLKESCTDQDGSTLFGGIKCAQLGDPAKTCHAPINYSLQLWEACPKMCGMCKCDTPTTTTAGLGNGKTTTSTTTTIPVPVLCKFKRLDFSKVAHQNLGGWKRDGSDPIMRFSDVIKEGKVSLDLVISNTSEYHSKRPKQNGIGNAAGMVQVNVDGNTDVMLHMEFVKSGTDEPYVVGGFLLSIFDFDQSKKNKGVESVTTASFSKMWLADESEVDVIDNGKGSFTFQSVAEDIPGGTNNPTDVMELTKLQKKLAVGLRYDGHSSINMKFAVHRGKYGRNIFFSGASSMQCKKKDLAAHPDFEVEQEKKSVD